MKKKDSHVDNKRIRTEIGNKSSKLRKSSSISVQRSSQQRKSIESNKRKSGESSLKRKEQYAPYSETFKISGIDQTSLRKETKKSNKKANKTIDHPVKSITGAEDIKDVIDLDAPDDERDLEEVEPDLRL